MPRPSRLRYLGMAALLALALFAGAGKLGNFLPSLPNPFESHTVDRTQPALLQSLADAWGVRPAPVGKATWFSLSRNPAKA